MTAMSPLRRFAVAVTSLTCAAVLFRGNVASALVTRGDDVLRAGDLGAAVRYYTRATRFDTGSVVATDRLAFALSMRRGPGDALRAFAATDAALRTAPREPLLLADRAFASRQLGRWRAAERDFTEAATLAHDPRYAHLAAQMARAGGDRDAEGRHLRAALALDATYAPARALLGRLRR